MYTRFQLAKKYFHFYRSASNAKGHGVHSPFVFDLIKNVLNDKNKYNCYDSIETLREELLQDKRVIAVDDFGAGSLAVPGAQKKIADITRSFLKSKKFARLLFRIVQYYRPATIVELGTSLGLTSAYLAAGNENAFVYTLEGSKNVAEIAEENFNKLGIENIRLIQGKFDEKLPALLSQLPNVHLAFVDGNHRKTPTMAYFKQFLNNSAESTILVFDDIHWSVEMEEAWEEIRQHPAVTLTIDLFFMGLVFFRKDFKVKQHFTIRF